MNDVPGSSDSDRGAGQAQDDVRVNNDAQNHVDDFNDAERNEQARHQAVLDEGRLEGALEGGSSPHVFAALDGGGAAVAAGRVGFGACYDGGVVARATVAKAAALKNMAGFSADGQWNCWCRYLND
ncbi:hypothetical protein PC9H_006981 [Pleurotus ostreatus]|uniref:Uncharacterized protein n=1 Tax=Pleurotus ostreatus TaxID=5322 RepID=A0A8H6ZUT8_PLEOS|nr:uncharacterized protein PC9H_006981 [Pleurotus ostreatus]KAF7431259.1 hypothetical protein PC9H_006981 [Pleurotus ostreatus]KAJ8695726.1 hypothetical protein PTI98_008299 [Pleurotus ostreatus]